jgi:hypothetical protein
MMYETVVLDHPNSGTQFLRSLDAKAASIGPYLGTHSSVNVRTLCLGRGVSVQQAATILRRCSKSLTNLALSIQPESHASSVLLPIIRNELPRLRKLSISHKVLVPNSSKSQRHAVSGSRPHVPSGHGFSSNVTHLDFTDPWALCQADGTLDLDPSLATSITHLAFRFWAKESAGLCLRNILSSTGALSEAFPNLRMVVLLVHETTSPSVVSEFLRREGLKDEKRIVVMTYGKDMDYWKALRRGEDDLWTRAEEMI